jgi:tellurite resistance protein
MWLERLSDAQRRALLRLAHNVVVSDGLLDPNEEHMLRLFRREMDLAPDSGSEYIDLDGIEAVFPGRRERAVAVLNLIYLSYVDGAFEIEEECLLRQLGQRFAVSDREFMLMDNWVRRLIALEREARIFM